MISRKTGFLFLHIVCAFLNLFSNSCATDTLTAANFNTTNGEITVCPGDTIFLTCTHANDANDVTLWEARTDSGSLACTNVLLHRNAVDAACLPIGFPVVMNSDEIAPILSSTLQISATRSLDGLVVKCFRDAGANDQIGNVTLRVLDIPVPTLTILSQVSQSVVRVNLSVDDPQCVGSYRVDASQEDTGSVSTNSNSSTVGVGGLDICRFNYSFLASVFTAGGVQSNLSLSSPVSFTADFSVLNGTSLSVNQADPLLKWTQINSFLYPTCITGYTISGGGRNTTVNSTVTSLTTQQLFEAQFPYCATLQPTITPLTPMKPLQSVEGDDSTVPRDPGFVTPTLLFTPLLENDIATLRVMIQNISDSVVPNRTYQYTNSTGAVSPKISFTGSYFQIAVEAEQTVSVTVMFQNMLCVDMSSDNFTVPSREIADVMNGSTTDTTHTVSFTLPLTPYQPEELLIISTVEPPNGNPVMANFSGPGMQYSVIFDNLMAGTSYTFTIKIVLRANTTVDVVPAAMGTFMTLITPTTAPPPTTMATTTTSTQAPTQPTAAPQGCGVGCIVGIIIGFLIVLVLVVVIIVVVLCYWSKTRKSGAMKVSSSHEMGQHSEKLTPSHGDQVDPVSDSPPTETFKNADAADPPADKSPDVIPGNEDADAGPDSNALIYADLEMATKGKNKAKVDATVTPTGGAEGHEAVEYASIEHIKKSDKSEDN